MKDVPQTPRGRFISFEGIDRCGKSTQARLLKRSLDSYADITCLLTAEPGGSGELGSALRKIVLDPAIERDEITATLLFSADRHEHVVKTIKPTLDQGRWVISDRYVDSTLAYQGGGGKVPIKLITDLTQIATVGLMPDLTVLLELDSDKRSKRSPKLDYYDQGSNEYDQRVTAVFAALAEQEPERFLVLDGSQDIQTIAKQIMSVVKKRFLNER